MPKNPSAILIMLAMITRGSATLKPVAATGAKPTSRPSAAKAKSAASQAAITKTNVKTIILVIFFFMTVYLLAVIVIAGHPVAA